MKKLVFCVYLFAILNVTYADTFGTGANQFTIDFVTISGDASSANGTNISLVSPGSSNYKSFVDPGNDYCIGVHEITNNQWTKFKTAYGIVTGNPTTSYDQAPTTDVMTGKNKPSSFVSWYEAAQFVNWLNMSNGHSPAYRFTGSIHTNSYALDVWNIGDDGYNANNPFRNRNAFYFLPTEDEWVKAAYWNGTNIQTYATKSGLKPVSGSDSNYSRGTNPIWDVGSGTEELNGTFDMMGNVDEWIENPFYSGDSLPNSLRGYRGGSYNQDPYHLVSYYRANQSPDTESGTIGFRVASVPEPATLLLLAIGQLMLRRKK